MGLRQLFQLFFCLLRAPGSRCLLLLLQLLLFLPLSLLPLTSGALRSRCACRRPSLPLPIGSQSDASTAPLQLGRKWLGLQSGRLMRHAG